MKINGHCKLYNYTGVFKNETPLVRIETNKFILEFSMFLVHLYLTP